MTFGLKVYLNYWNLQFVYPTTKFELVYSDSHLNVLDIMLHFNMSPIVLYLPFIV